MDNIQQNADDVQKVLELIVPASVQQDRARLDTLPSKNMNLPYSIHMYWKIFWQPTVHKQQNIFEKTHIKAYSPDLYASLGTFCVQIGQLLAAK